MYPGTTELWHEYNPKRDLAFITSYEDLAKEMYEQGHVVHATLQLHGHSGRKNCPPGNGVGP